MSWWWSWIRGTVFTKKAVGITDSYFGEDVEIYEPSNIYGAAFGNNVRIGPFVEIQRDVLVGDNVRIGSHTFIARGTIIGSNVFIGHHVVFCNCKHPVAGVTEIALDPQDLGWMLQAVKVGDGAIIGSGAVLLPGIVIGPGATVGAGAVVTEDVPASSIVAGNPARILQP